MSTPPDTYLTPAELCRRLGVSVPTYKRWRADGYGPAAHKFGRLVRFHLADVETWEATQREGVGS